jgi:DNA-binding SARP family transcriptional activator
LALTYLLLASGRPVPADQLAEAVWPQGPPASWPSSVRRIVSDVRNWLRSGDVEAEVRSAHGTYQVILPPGVSTDVDSARDELEWARAASALDRVDDEALGARRAAELLDAPLAPGYDAPWLEQLRQDLERDFLQTLDLLADAERRRGEPDAAVGAAERAIAIDPLRESSYRLAMVGHRQAGRIGAALRAYETCRRTLADEVGTAPSPATTTVYHALLDLQVEREPEPPVLLQIEEREGAIAAAAARMTRLESRQEVATLEARLATIDAAPSPDPHRRVQTLIELGRARWMVEGSTEALRRISLAAGEAALSLGLADEFGQALALASTTTGIGQIDPDAEDQCRRGRELFAGHPHVQVQILGLQAELEVGQRSIELAEQAVAAARDLGDPRLVLDMLLVLDQSLAWTPDISRRFDVAEECNTLLRLLPPFWRRRPTFEVMTRLQSADVDWLDEQGDRYPEGGRRTRSWELRTYLAALRGVEAKLTGDLERAQAIGNTLLAEAGNELNTMHAAGGLLLAIARETGGLEDLLPAIEAIVDSNERITAFRAALAAARATVGDAAGARRVVDDLASAGLDDVPHDHVYLLYLGLLAEAVALLDHAPLVDPLLELLAPYEGLLCVGAHGLVVLNAMDTYRGMLATVTGDARGPAWFDAGMEVEARVRGVLLRARSAAWKAAFLRRHGTRDDEAEIERLLAEARAVAAAEPDRGGLRDMVEHLGADAP